MCRRHEVALGACEDVRPRKLANVERSQRYDSQAIRLRGLDLTGEMEVSHSLIDLIGQFVEDNALSLVVGGCNPSLPLEGEGCSLSRICRRHVLFSRFSACEKDQ